MDYIEILQKNELKVTPQRLEIVEILFQNGHINIDELFIKLKIKFPTLSLATIYKNLNTMQDKGLVCEVKIPHQKSVYELTKDEHSHAVCLKCNDVMDIVLDTTRLVSKAKEISHYELNNSSIVFSGLCPKCA
jgi:Fur family peroxide stress response transcriptional regulator